MNYNSSTVNHYLHSRVDPAEVGNNVSMVITRLFVEAMRRLVYRLEQMYMLYTFKYKTYFTIPRSCIVLVYIRV